jgi:hypothetical protein
VPATPAGYTPAGYSPDDPLVLSAGWSSLVKEGAWTVPPFLLLKGDFSSVRLDCQRAQAAADVVHIQVVGGAGSILIVLPEGWAADLDRVTAGLGSRRSKVVDMPVAGSPILVLEGAMGMGSLTVRYPTWWDRRRLRRQLKKEARLLR